MNAVMLSIRPEWCEKILNGKKTVEVRKTFPHDHMPFKCYIYCTSGPKFLNMVNGVLELIDSDFLGGHLGLHIRLNKKVVGEFICNRFDTINKRGFDDNYDYCYESLNVWGNDDIETEIMAIKKSCIGKKELNEYGKNSHCLYAWHISNLKIYDKPKELSSFWVESNATTDYPGMKRMSRPPQSWCYVEAMEGVD